jgi:hypothetical protein
MKLNDYILETPSYGWSDAEGNFIKPTFGQIFIQRIGCLFLAGFGYFVYRLLSFYYCQNFRFRGISLN